MSLITEIYRWLKVKSFGIRENEHCVKSVRIRSNSGLHFPAFRLNTERYSVSLRIQSKCGEIRTRKIPNTDTFLAVKIVSTILHGVLLYSVLYNTPFFDLNATIHRYVRAFQHNHKKRKDSLETQTELVVLRPYVENQLYQNLFLSTVHQNVDKPKSRLFITLRGPTF